MTPLQIEGVDNAWLNLSLGFIPFYLPKVTHSEICIWLIYHSLKKKKEEKEEWSNCENNEAKGESLELLIRTPTSEKVEEWVE